MLLHHRPEGLQLILLTLSRVCVIQSWYISSGLVTDGGNAMLMRAYHKIQVLRDGVGVFATLMAFLLLQVQSYCQGEEMNILETMREAMTRGWSNIGFEIDSEVVVEATYKLIPKE
ncbi:hypothetical protein P8452_76486 [Trifolium repens]|nr:hypothetical protein P8452_76486 [Trifolium repens]